MVYLPTFTIKISQMSANIPYMDGKGYGFQGQPVSFQRSIVSSHYLGGISPQKNKVTDVVGEQKCHSYDGFTTISLIRT